MSFPAITVADMVRLQKKLIDHWGFGGCLAVAGGSMGGMQALEWAVAYPDNVLAALPIATTARHSAQQIAFNEVGTAGYHGGPGLAAVGITMNGVRRRGGWRWRAWWGTLLI